MASRILSLTSPHLTGPDVTHLQTVLKKNAFDKNFLPDGRVDGEFGTLTAQAVYRAQYWLGYAKPIQSCGTILPAYLEGKKTLPITNRVRRNSRIRSAAAARPLRAKALAEALTHVGVKEDPAGSNRQKFGAWYGWNGVAWCAMFVSYCYTAAGSKNTKKLARWAYCPYIVADARAGRNGLTVTKSPKPGDVVLFDREKDGVANHVGLFDHWIKEGVTFASVEGNTSPANASNGGQVVHYGTGPYKPRSVADVIIFAHLAS